MNAHICGKQDPSPNHTDTWTNQRSQKGGGQHIKSKQNQNNSKQTFRTPFEEMKNVSRHACMLLSKLVASKIKQHEASKGRSIQSLFIYLIN